MVRRRDKDVDASSAIEVPVPVARGGRQVDPADIEGDVRLGGHNLGKNVDRGFRPVEDIVES